MLSKAKSIYFMYGQSVEVVLAALELNTTADGGCKVSQLLIEINLVELRVLLTARECSTLRLI